MEHTLSSTHISKLEGWMLHPNIVQIGMVIGIGIAFFLPVSIFIVVLAALSTSQMRSKGDTGTLPSAARVNLTLHPKQGVIQLLTQSKYRGGDGSLPHKAHGVCYTR